MILIDDIYNVLKQSVRYSPKTLTKCGQLQSFAVLDSLSNLSTENLAKVYCDKDKPYFYSRIWEDLRFNPSQLKINYPLLILFELNTDVTDLFTKKQQSCYNLQLMVVDSYKEDKCRECTNCKDCESRTINEIYRDTEALLYQSLNYLSELIVTNNGLILNLTHFNYLNDMYPGVYIKNVAKSNQLNNSLRQSGTQNSSFRYEGKGADNLYGTAINIKICLDKCNDVQLSYDYSIDNEMPIHDIGCC